MSNHRLIKSKDEMIFGVCGGVAEYLRIDPTIVRIIWAALALAYGTGVVLYIIMAIIMPDPPGGKTKASGSSKANVAEEGDEIIVEVMPENDELNEKEKEPGKHRNHESIEPSKPEAKKTGWWSVHNGIQWIVIGILILLFNLGILQFPVIRTLLVFWPVFLIGAGLSMIFRRWPVVETLIFLLTVGLFIVLGTQMASGDGLNTGRHSTRYIDTVEIGELQESVSLDMDLNFVSGRIETGDLDDDRLYTISSDGVQIKGTYNESDRNLIVRDEREGRRVVLMPFQQRSFRMTLSDRPLWDIDASINVGRLDWDLQGVDLESFTMKGNVSEMTATFPWPQGTVPVAIDANVSELTLLLPRDSAYQIQGNRNLSQLNVAGEGISGTRYSQGYQESQDRYTITINSSVSSVRVRYYDHD